MRTKELEQKYTELIKKKYKDSHRRINNIKDHCTSITVVVNSAQIWGFYDLNNDGNFYVAYMCGDFKDFGVLDGETITFKELVEFAMGLDTISEVLSWITSKQDVKKHFNLQ